MSLKQWAKFFIIAMVALLLRGVNTYNDIVLALEYIQGHNYTYYNTNNSYIELFLEHNCTFWKHEFVVVDNDLWICHVQDPLLGILTIALTFLPGLLLSIFLACGLKNPPLPWIKVILISPICMTIFPFLSYGMKASVCIILLYPSIIFLLG